MSTTGEQEDVEELSEALLASVEEDAESDNHTGVPDAVITAIATMRKLGIDFVRRYHRLEIDSGTAQLDSPVLFVANHGFGGIFDLNVFSILATFDDLKLDRPVTALTHQIAWTLQVGKLLEPFGARPASRQAALEAFERAEHVLVLPGGDIDAFKAFSDRDKIVFDGRTGFARLAMDAGVPIVPIVTAGAGESLYVLSDGKRLAKALRLDKLLRTKALPVSVSLPWGINVGAVGLLPYLPLPTKLLTAVLPPMSPETDEDATSFAGRVEIAMQKRLTELAQQRRG